MQFQQATNIVAALQVKSKKVKGKIAAYFCLLPSYFLLKDVFPHPTHRAVTWFGCE